MDPIFEAISSYPEGDRFFYLAGILFLAALGLIPTTTDIIMVLVGILVSKGLLDPFYAAFLCFFTIAIAETLMFEFGVLFGSKVLKSRLILKMLPRPKMDRLKEKLTGSTLDLVTSIRFNPILRPLQILCLASLKADRQGYYLLSYLFLIIYVPILIFLTAWLASFINIRAEWIIYLLIIVWSLGFLKRKLSKNHT